MLRSMFEWMRAHWLLLVAAGLLLCAAEQLAYQWKDRDYLQALTNTVIKNACARTAEQKALALRDYLRQNVAFDGAPVEGRPYLRASAAETLKSGKGYCGEVSRAFICMAGLADIPAQRINLYGGTSHVVAEVELGGKNWIVDCQNPPAIADLEPIEQVMRERGYFDYSTLNVRRLGLDSFFSRIKLRMGPLTYWGENPHALRAAFWFALAGLVLLFRPLRWSVRAMLKRRGWIHESDKPKLHAALNGLAEVGPGR